MCYSPLNGMGKKKKKTNNGHLGIPIQFVPLKRKASIGPEKPWAQTRIITCRILPFKLIENVSKHSVYKNKK